MFTDFHGFHMVFEAYELLAAPIRLLIKFQLSQGAQEVEAQRASAQLSDAELLVEERKRNSSGSSEWLSGREIRVKSAKRRGFKVFEAHFLGRQWSKASRETMKTDGFLKELVDLWRGRLRSSAYVFFAGLISHSVGKEVVSCGDYGSILLRP